MNKVYSLQEVERWFLSNPSGTVRCYREGAYRDCTSNSVARAFYEASDLRQSASEADDESDDGLGFVSGLVTGELASEMLSPDVSTPDPAPEASSFESSGGDFGGAGAGSDF